MINKKGTPKKTAVFNIMSFALIIAVVLFFSGCSGMYGSYKRDATSGMLKFIKPFNPAR